MNKKQLTVVAIIIILISIVILTTPTYVKRYSSGEFVNWSIVFQRIIPILLIGGSLLYLFRKPINFKQWLSRIFKYILIPIIISTLTISVGLYIKRRIVNQAKFDSQRLETLRLLDDSKDIERILIIDRETNSLSLIEHGKIIKEYPIVTGASLTPKGEFKIVNKLIDPVWYKDGQAYLSSNSENILGSRWMGLDKPGYGIFGNYEKNLEKGNTSGGISMKRHDIEELYNIVSLGTKVIIK